ncbi:DUF305 domain-containing protein [Arthrobacter sp. MYb213]|uniref:DUF305 domain-containing protein n=1 Tax=Arthrobacter sp. MYb213 TaxID=1848595 RepID=UPI0025705300|nr:DUF305 domain-containing protein [Arthrobacter sp. MYb213]
MLILSGCVGEPQEAPAQSPSASASHSGHSMSQSVSANEADMAFALGMKMHHEQAIEMSDILLEKESIPEDIAALATRIKAAQSPEIEHMDRWLAEWDMSEAMDHPSMEHGDGMVPEDEIKALKEASGNQAAKLFLEQMITHHEGAVDMAETEINEGSYPAAIELSKGIVKSQNEEIQEMKQLLAAL